jgi:elongation factor P
MKANDLKRGTVISFNDSLWMINKTEHVKPGKGPAYIQAEMRNIMTGTKLSQRFRSSETMEQMNVIASDYSFSYKSGDNYVFSNEETFEELLLNKDTINNVEFLKEGAVISISFCDDKVVEVKLPEHVACTVVSTEGVTKGQTASSSYKPAILDNGVTIQVPPHIEAGIVIIVSTSTMEYVRKQ